MIKIVPSVEARAKAIDTFEYEKKINPDDKLVTQIIRLKYADAEEIRKVFTPFVSKTGLMASYKATNMLIIIDVLSNIHRIMGIIEKLDVEGIGRQITILPLRYASAVYLSKILGNIFKPQVTAQKAPQQAQAAPVVEAEIVIIPEERLNLLIVLATESDTRRVKELVAALDKEAPRDEGNIRVYYLQYASAEELLSVLAAIPRKEHAPTTAATAQAAPGAQPKAPTTVTGQAVISKDVSISADKATNSLIIASSKEDYQVIEDVIKKLDIPRMMIYLEALIMEVSVNKEFNLGVEWQAADQIGSYEGRAIGAFAGATYGAKTGNFPTFNTTTGMASLPSGFSLGVLGEGISINTGVGKIVFPNIGAVVRAFRGDSDINILSTPQILTLDNQEAEIKVGKNVPYLTRLERTATNLDYSNYEYKDVGVTLKITPQINRERMVRLKLFQEVTQIVKEESQTGLPTTLKRAANTTVMLKDGQTVVIGGLIDNSLNAAEYSVPCLGGMPGLGWLFKSVSKSSNRTNLFVFLTPHIIENPLEAAKVMEEKKKHMDELQENAIKMYPGEGVFPPKPRPPKGEMENTEVSK